jgi:hypothetical protein
MDVSADGFRQRPGWLLVVAALLLGQAWLTLRLFTPDLTLAPLLSDNPVVSGRHPLHSYHGQIGAKAWLARGTSSCFDPTFQAGYPKTPVFDGGSRPAELFHVLGGSRPAAYKLGLAICCLLVPVAFTLMGRGAGLTVPASCAAGLLGSLLWWSAPCQGLVAAGDLDLLLGGLCVLVHVCWLVRFERDPGLDGWAVLTGSGALAWFTQPLLIAAYLPFLLLYYLWVATRQGPLWHLAIVASAGVAFGVNYAWLQDWAKNLWVYLPGGGELPPPAPLVPALLRAWKCLLPLDPVQLGVGAAGLVGLLAMLKGNRGAAWLLAVGALLFTGGAAAGQFWPVLGELGTGKLLLLAAWCLVVPAARVLAGVAAHLGDASGWRPVGLIWLVVGLSGLAWSLGLPRSWVGRPALEVGLNEERSEIVRTLGEQTTSEARILWEDRTDPGRGWTALLAELTGRAYLGGLDPRGRVEHMYPRLCDGKLGGKPLAEWPAARLRQFADRYNVGWVTCWTPESIEHFRNLPFAKPVAELNDGGAGVLFALDRKPSFFLKGRGKWVQADWDRIALADVEPENGEVVISAHYQSNFRVAPVYVQVERDLDLDDPIPLIRLRLPGPVARLSIVWDNP